MLVLLADPTQTLPTLLNPADPTQTLPTPGLLNPTDFLLNATNFNKYNKANQCASISYSVGKAGYYGASICAMNGKLIGYYPIGNDLVKKPSKLQVSYSGSSLSSPGNVQVNFKHAETSHTHKADCTVKDNSVTCT